MPQHEPSQKKQKFDFYQLVNITQKLNYIYYLFITSLLFWVMNLPFLLSILTVDLRLVTLPIFLITSLSLGPTFQALLMTMHQIEQKNVFLSFFEGLKLTWRKALAAWSAVVVIVGLISANLLLQSLTQLFPSFKWFLLFLLVIVLAFIINYFLLLMAYPQTPLKNAVVTTFQLSIFKSGRYALNLLIVLSIAVLMTSIPIYLFLFGIGIVAWLLELNYRKVIQSVEASLL